MTKHQAFEIPLFVMMVGFVSFMDGWVWLLSNFWQGVALCAIGAALWFGCLGWYADWYHNWWNNL